MESVIIMRNIYDLLDIRERSTSEWKDHIVNLKRTYTSRRNSPDVEKQQEATRCLSAVSCMERVLDDLPDGNKWTALAIKVVLHYNDRNELDKEYQRLIDACQGNADSIIQISKGNLPPELKKEWDETIGKGLMNKPKSGKRNIIPFVIVAVLVILIIILVKSCGGKDEKDNTLSEESKSSEEITETSVQETPDPTQSPTSTPTPTPTPTPTEEPTPTVSPEKALVDFEFNEKNHASVEKSVKDRNGNEYKNALLLSLLAYDYSNEPYYARCYVYKEYTLFSGDIGYYEPNVTIPDTQEGAKKFQILCDDREVYSMDISPDTPLQHVEVDVSGAKCVEFRYGDGHGYSHAIIVNGVFKRDGVPDTSGNNNIEVTDDNAIEMPNLIGMNVSEASELLTDMDITAKAAYIDSSEYEKDTIISQDIEPGTPVEKNIVINLQVSSGK